MSKPKAIDLDSIIDESGDRIVRKPLAACNPRASG